MAITRRLAGYAVELVLARRFGVGEAPGVDPSFAQEGAGQRARSWPMHPVLHGEAEQGAPHVFCLSRTFAKAQKRQRLRRKAAKPHEGRPATLARRRVDR